MYRNTLRARLLTVVSHRHRLLQRLATGYFWRSMVLFCDGILLNERYPEEFAYDHKTFWLKRWAGTKWLRRCQEENFVVQKIIRKLPAWFVTASGLKASFASLSTKNVRFKQCMRRTFQNVVIRWYKQGISTHTILAGRTRFFSLCEQLLWP